jgi:hypothetical protein
MHDLKLTEIPDGQTSATLMTSFSMPVLDIDAALRTKVIGKIPDGNRSCIISVWLGSKNICFQHVRNFSTPALRKLKTQIGEKFNIVLENEKENPLRNEPNLFEGENNAD